MNASDKVSQEDPCIFISNMWALRKIKDSAGKLFAFKPSDIIMNEYIYHIFEFFVDIPVNIGVHINVWLWLLPIVTPILIFFMKVERSILSYTLRIICAIGLTYILLNLSLHTRHNLEFVAYHQCQKDSIHWEGSKKAHDECEHHISPSGANYVFALGLGWALAAFYVGIWEIIWRIRHRKKIREMGKNFKGKWLSNVAISFILMPFISFALLILWFKIR